MIHYGTSSLLFCSITGLAVNVGASLIKLLTLSFIYSKNSTNSLFGLSFPRRIHISISRNNTLNPPYVCLCPSHFPEYLKNVFIVDITVINIAQPAATPGGASSGLKLNVDNTAPTKIVGNDTIVLHLLKYLKDASCASLLVISTDFNEQFDGDQVLFYFHLYFCL